MKPGLKPFKLRKFKFLISKKRILLYIFTAPLATSKKIIHMKVFYKLENYMLRIEASNYYYLYLYFCFGWNYGPTR